MEKSKVKKKKAIKLKLERSGRVTVNESDVGYLVFETEKKRNKDHVLHCFREDVNAVTMMRKIRMPKEFTFVWVDKLYVKQSKRGKGYGAKILKALERKYKNHTIVLGLSPGEMVKTSDIRRLIPFYESLGFKIVTSDVHHYGFKVIKRQSV